MRMKVDREILLSLLTSAMLSSAGAATIGDAPILAGAVNIGGVQRAIETAFAGVPSTGLSIPTGYEHAAVSEPRAMLASARSRSEDSPEAEAFRRLMAKTVAINDEGPLGPGITGSLNLEQNLVVRQMEVVDGADAHYFNVAMDGSGRFILFSRIDGIVYGFALDAQRRPAAAAVRRDGKTTPVTIDSVRPQLMRMMAFWMQWAAQNASVAQG